MRRAVVLFVALASLLTFAGSARAAAGPVASHIEGLFWAITGFAIAISILVYGALIWFLIRYRRSANPNPSHIEGNRRLEIAWTVFPTIILIIITGISVPVLTFTDTPPPADTWVTVTGQRFTWQFTYEDGNTTEEVMWIQAGTVVHINVTSMDVVHSFAVPQLAIKIDALPHHTNAWWILVDEPGDYLNQCAEYCGSGHYGMRATIRVFTAEARQQEAARAGVAPKPYGPPPVPPEVTEVRMQETENVTRPFRIVPDRLEYRLGQNVTLRVRNEASQPYDFRIDVPVTGVNQTQPIAPFANQTITFELRTPASANVPYGPSDPTVRAQGMVGDLTIQSGRIIRIIFRETGCPAPKTLCLVTDQEPIRIAKGAPVMFELRNEGEMLHNFLMDYPGFEVSDHIDGGDTVFFGPFTFQDDASGKYWCNVGGHRGAGMEGDYIIGEGSTRPATVPVFDMMVITGVIVVPAIFVFIFRHASRRDEQESG